jgi:hypothetical protein
MTALIPAPRTERLPDTGKDLAAAPGVAVEAPAPDGLLHSPYPQANFAFEHCTAIDHLG